MSRNKDTTPAEPRSAHEWQLLFDHLPQSVAIYSTVRDDRGRIIDFLVEYVNAAACRSLGLAREEQIGRRLNDLLPGHRQSGLFGAYCRVVDTGRGFSRDRFKFTDIFGDHVETHSLDLHVEKYEDGLLATWRETPTSDAGSSGGKLSKGYGDQRLRLALGAGRMGTWQWDIASGAVKWSEELERIHGLEPGEFDGTFEGFQRDIEQDHRERVLQTIQRALDSRSDFLVEYPVVLPDGRRRWVEGRGSVETDEQGQPVGMVGVCADVTERHRADAALEARFRQLHAIYRLSEALSKAPAVEGITEVALDGLMEAVGADRASVLLFDDDEVMRFRSWRGLSEEYRRAVTGHSPWTPRDSDATPVAIEDVESADDLGELRAVILREGIRALAFIPLLSNGRVLGKFMVYFNRPHAFTEEEFKLCQAIAGHISYAMERTQSEAAIRESESRHRELSSRLRMLLETTSRLIESLDTAELLQSVLDFSRDIVAADAFAVWRVDARGTWSVAASNGLSEEFLEESLHAEAVGELPETPIVVQPDDLRARKLGLLEQRWDRYEREGIRSLMILPLPIGGELSGTLVFYCNSEHRFSDMEIESARALSNIAAAVLTMAGLYETQSRLRERAEKSAMREAFLAAAGPILSQSLDYEQTLVNVARAAVPRFADWCSVDILDEAGVLRRLAVAHADPQKAALARDWSRRYPPENRLHMGVLEVIRTGRSELMSQISDELIEQVARDEDHLQLLRELRPCSYICVPVHAEGEVCGAMTFVSAESGRHFDGADLATAEELASRATHSIEHAMLHRRTEEGERRYRSIAESLRTRAHQQQVVATLGELALRERDLQRVYDYASEALADTLGTEFCKVLELNEDGKSLLLRAGVGWREGVVGAATVSTGADTPAGASLRSDVPVVVSDLREETGFSEALLKEHGVVSGMSCIIRSAGGAPWGVLGTYSRQRCDFTPEDVSFLVAVAHVLSSAIQRDQSERALRESDAQFRQVVEAVPAGLYMTDAEGRVKLFNKAAADLWGREPKIGVDMWCGSWRIYKPDGTPVPLDRCPMANALQNGHSGAEEVVIERPDGTRRHVMPHPVPLFGSSGQLIGAVNMLVDITEAREAEDALRESERRFRLMADAAPVLIWVSDADKQGVYFNERWLAFTGRSLEQELGDGWLAGIHPEDYESTASTWLGAFDRGEPFRIEFRLRRSDGQYRWVLNHGVPRYSDTGAIAGYIGSCVDVTERHEIEEALRESEERYRATFASAPVGIAHTSLAEGRWMRFNDAVCEILGHPREELEQMTFADVTHPDDMQADWKQARALLIGDIDTYSIEKRCIRKDGSIVWVNLTVSLLHDTHGRPLHYIAIIEDIAERKRAVEDLQRARDELEQRVAHRTHELQHRAEQLSRLTTELTLAEQRERQRLARVLHDHLQQLLASAKLGLGFLGRDGDPEQTEWVEHTRNSIEEAIDAARSLSVELAPPILQHGGLVAGFEWLARWMKEKHDLDVHLELDPRANPGREDVRTLIFESVRELLFNVVKHAQVGTASLELSLHGEDQLRVVIADDGQGFDAEEVFVRRTRQGFGLFSIQERLLLLGGSFNVESKIGDGTIFTLIAPLSSGAGPGNGQMIEPKPEAQVRPGKEIERASPRLSNGDRLRLLIVDDDASMRRGLCALFSTDPTIEVVGQATDGIEACEHARDLEPDVILMDYSMPGMDGVEATRRIRRELPLVRIIGLSTYEESDRAEAMMEAGAEAYFRKSRDLEKLIGRVMAFKR